MSDKATISCSSVMSKTCVLSLFSAAIVFIYVSPLNAQPAGGANDVWELWRHPHHSGSPMKIQTYYGTDGLRFCSQARQSANGPGHNPVYLYQCVKKR